MNRARPVLTVARAIAIAIAIATLASFVVVAVGVCRPPAPAGVAWARWDAEVVTLLQQYLRLDTSNPPGHEAIAADFLQAELKQAGIAVQRFTVAPGRDNLIARLQGDGSARPLILTHHMDVVGAVAADWQQPPFSGALVKGEIWGRGALDMKATGIVHLLIMKMLAVQKTPLARDIIFLALADEEEGSSGAKDFLEHHAELVRDAEFLINEGATIRAEKGRTAFYAIDTMEKAALWLELEARGPDGHGSAPLANSAINRLVAALGHIQASPMPIVLTPSVASYLKGTADKAKPELRAKLAEVERWVGDAAFMDAVTADPLDNALLRNTVAITGLDAGSQVNIIPAKAVARLDCRLLPGQEKAEFLRRLKAIISDDSIVIRETYSTPGNESPLDTVLVHAIEKVAARHDPGVPVFALPLTSTTDSSLFRPLGIHAYGFEPFLLSEQDELLCHAANERLSVSSLQRGLHFLYEVVTEVASR